MDAPRLLCRMDEVPARDDGIAQRMTARERFDSFERDLDDFEALRVCVG